MTSHTHPFRVSSTLELMTDTASSSEPKHSAFAKLSPNPGIRMKNLQGCNDESWNGQSRDVWIDVEAATPEQIEALKAHFAFNKLALEDVLVADHWSRFERYPEHLFLIFRTLADPERLVDRTQELDIFWFPDQHALVTFRDEPIGYLETIWGSLESFSQRAPINILYDLLQRGTDTFFAFLEAFENRTETLEQRLFAPPSRREAKLRDVHTHDLYEEIFASRRALNAIRKQVFNAREYVTQFSHHTAEVLPEGAIYLRDVADHLSRVYSGLDAARDVLGSLLEVYLNVENQRLNEVIGTLTTVSTIFLPLTFLAGVWGMNFRAQPEYGWPYGYLMAWASFIVISVSLLWYFKRKRWW